MEQGVEQAYSLQITVAEFQPHVSDGVNSRDRANERDDRNHEGGQGISTQETKRDNSSRGAPSRPDAGCSETAGNESGHARNTMDRLHEPACPEQADRAGSERRNRKQ